MRLIRNPLPLVLLTFAAAGALRGQDPAGWNLEWSDEFSQADGSAPDAAKWLHETGGSGWGNNELQFYTDRRANSRVEDGRLVIEARREAEGGRDFTSARLITKGRWQGTFGRIEARMKLPRGQGIWPAFWMLGANFSSVGWPECGEIDIMEHIGREPATVHGTLHGPGFSGAGGLSGRYQLMTGTMAEDFHVFAIEWERDRVRWFLDGQPFFTRTPADLPPGGRWVFNAPHYLLLNLAVGGNWPGNPDGTTVFPQQLLVDYVRVYSRGEEPPPPEPEARVTVDPAAAWRGYMNVYDLPANGGAYRFGQVWPVAELPAVFRGPVLELAPNSIADPSTFYYIGGGGPGRPGNKRMSASVYVEDSAELSGRTVVFTGEVTAATLTSAHRVEAFIRDFSGDYSSQRSATKVLGPGPFEVRLETLPGPGRHVQYGFQLAGVNVWSTDVASFGTMKITAGGGDPFAAWIAGFDFPAGADRSPQGDPDGDGATNLSEFALAGDPLSGAVSGRTRCAPGADGALWLTLPVRGEPVFAGGPALSATSGPVRYTVEGSRDLVGYGEEITEVAAQVDGLPPLGAGWRYRTFRLAGPPAAGGFLRVRISPAP